jgi:hypothetical protein
VLEITATNSLPFFETDLVEQFDVVIGEAWSYNIPPGADIESEVVSTSVELGVAE